MLAGRAVVERGAQAARVVEALDEVEYLKAAMPARRELQVLDPLRFQCVEDALGDGVVLTPPGSTRAADDPALVELALVLGSQVLATAVRVVQDDGPTAFG